MPYATPADMIARFGEREMTELTDQAGAGVPDVAEIARTLDEVSAEIDGYLRDRYALPLSVTPAVIARIACDMARYQLAVERTTDEMKTRYDAAAKMLADIASGKLKLGLAPATVATPGAGGTLEVASRSRPRDWGMLA